MQALLKYLPFAGIIAINSLAVADTEITQKKFQEQADTFWESIDGKSSYLKSAPKLEYNN